MRPFARTGAASVPSFFSGWIVSELPLHTSALQALADLGAIRKGALRSRTGRALLAADVVSWSQRYRLHRESGMADRTFDDALADELGADYRTRAASIGVPSTDRSIPLPKLVQPFSVARRTLAAEHDLNYGEAGKRNYLDVWKRADLPLDGRAPVLLQVHGGAWMIGNKNQQGQPLMEHLTGRGWICVAINYQLSPHATWPAHIVDVKRAIGWVKANIARTAAIRTSSRSPAGRPAATSAHSPR